MLFTIRIVLKLWVWWFSRSRGQKGAWLKFKTDLKFIYSISNSLWDPFVYTDE